MADVPDKHIERFRSLINEASVALIAAEELLISVVGEDPRVTSHQREDVVGRVIEGIFNGQNMVADDGKVYPVQANYASKSRLVQGDRLKLTIGEDGSFTYKPIGPVPKTQVVGVLVQKEGHYYVKVGEKLYQVLLASVTHYKIRPGDQISVKIPQDNPDCDWAAIEAPL